MKAAWTANGGVARLSAPEHESTSPAALPRPGLVPSVPAVERQNTVSLPKTSAQAGKKKRNRKKKAAERHRGLGSLYLIGTAAGASSGEETDAKAEDLTRGVNRLKLGPSNSRMEIEE